MADKQVEQTPAAKAPDQAPAPVPMHGAGVAALEAMLSRGRPDPHDVVALIDAHRSERDPMLAMLQTRLGNGYVREVIDAMGKLRASIKRREIVDGDPSQPDSGYFVASQAEQGARWRTADGDFAGKIDKSGLDARYRLDSDDALHGTVDAKDKTAALGWEHDGSTVGELYAHKGKVTLGPQPDATAPTDASTTDLGVRRGFDLGDGKATLGLRHESRNDGHSNDGISGTFKDGTSSGEAYLARDSSGAIVGGASGTTQLDPNTSLSGTINRDPASTSATISAGHKFDAHTTGAASLAYVQPDHGPGQTTLAMSEHHGDGNVVQDSHLTLGAGRRDYVDTGGSIETGLGNNLYGGAWGQYHAERGQKPTAQVGASLTFTPAEKSALTLAGIVDEHGALETRLQLDIFKSKVDSVQSLTDHQKSALVSLFVSYTTGSSTQPHMLDDRFGAPQLETTTHDSKVMFGFRVKF